ncbi:MAG: tetratricopeptide repeat protein [Myxococcota bacterium]
MSPYPDDNSGMDVFLRSNNDQPLPGKSAEEPSRQGGSGMGPILIAMLALAVVGTAAFAWYVYQPEMEIALTTPPERSYPYTASAEYLTNYDEIAVIVGPDAKATNAADTNINWSITGDGYASIHLNLNGSGPDAEAWVEWIREQGDWRGDQGGWVVQSASYRFEGGDRVTIPIGPGTFLTADELQTWRTSDGSTDLGRGKRELIQGHLIQAVQSFKNAMAENPDAPEPLYWQGRAFEALGNDTRAQSAYQQLVEMDPENARALARLDAMRASPPPGKPKVDPPRASPPTPENAPVNLIPR